MTMPTPYPEPGAEGLHELMDADYRGRRECRSNPVVARSRESIDSGTGCTAPALVTMAEREKGRTNPAFRPWSERS